MNSRLGHTGSADCAIDARFSSDIARRPTRIGGVPQYSPTGPDDAPLTEAIWLPVKRGFVVDQAVRDDHGDSRPGSTLESSRAWVADGVECKLAEAVVTTRRPNGDPDDLPFRKGEVLTVISKDEEQWWTARNSLGQTGSIPVPYVERVRSRLRGNTSEPDQSLKS
ncbi:hypothetical protein HPB47_013613 [Ixodes persulcatus]|uniref:Uncharacterized protein n=1 Tax=Ixodes persulcatus TaxID=34615 RepID=A0AC60R2Z2_IXOPE|nr:hypothetical protein HPB47_013613 [Ixodes persulcatus]